MATIILDGYNLLGKTNQKERDDLILDLIEYKKTRKNDIIVFFDGTHGGTQFGDESISGNIKIVFTPLHVTADDQMIEYMEENPHKDIIAVSSDRKIQKAASRYMFSYFESDEFLQQIKKGKRTTDTQTDDDSPYLPKISTKKKGNPRKKSKKERRKIQQLKKI